MSGARYDVPLADDAFTDTGAHRAGRAQGRLNGAAFDTGLTVEAGGADTFDDPQVSPCRYLVCCHMTIVTIRKGRR